MKLSGPEWREIRDGLCDAFPSYRELERLLRDYFGENMDHLVAHSGNLKDAVDDIIKWFSARDKIPDLVKAAFFERPQNFFIQRLAHRWIDVPALPEQAVLERIFRQSNGFLDPEVWFVRFRDNINCVCQIEIKSRSDGYYFGSGVLIAPDIVLTNYHVIECVAEPEKFRENNAYAEEADVVIRFDNRKVPSGYIQPGVEHKLHSNWLVASSPYSQIHLEGNFDDEGLNASSLDYALLRLADSPGEQITTLGRMEFKRGWVRLNSQISSNLISGGLIVVQYPQGETLKLSMDTDAVGNNKFGSRIKHKVNTTNGSSGAPCFNLNWDLVAIHQAGISSTEFQKGYNIAIPISKIISSLQEKGLGNSLGLFI